MNEEEGLIRAFYTSFQQLDWRGMLACYHEDIFFYDPVFGDLEGFRARAMWQMLLSNAKDLQLSFSDIVAADDYGSCQWVATYRFSGTGRRVVNKVRSHFKFADGKIIEQQDVFSLWKWSRQALGIPGILFGWTPPLRNKIRKMAEKNLRKFILSHHLNPDDHVQSP